MDEPATGTAAATADEEAAGRTAGEDSATEAEAAAVPAVEEPVTESTSPATEAAASEPVTEPVTPATEPTDSEPATEPATEPLTPEPDTMAVVDEPGDEPDEPVGAVDGREDGPLLREVPELPAEGTTRTLVTALTRLRSEIGATPYPLVMPTAEEARRVGGALVAQLDDYLLPRLARLDAPLLVVVGGSTGAGKSTLVNSLVRAPVSASGVLRPTTRSPVLVCHPNDMSWFRSGELLPGLTRTPEVSADPNSLHLVAAPALGEGLAFLDAPDIDSVVDRNRELAAQLLAAADLWLFVTTAARYADAVPWELLHTARQRGTVTALVLDRVPPEAAGEVAAHLSEMLAANDLAAAPLFVLPESDLDGSGLLPEEVSGPLRDWFAHLAGDASARAAVVRQTLDGALAALRPSVTGLAAAADDQAVAAAGLTERVDAAYRNARRTVEQGLQDGRLLRGEVLARWQEFVGTGEFLRSLESRIGRLRDRITAAVTGRPAPGRNLQVALESQLATLFRGVAADAAEQAYTGWQAHPAGAALLTPALGRPSADLPERAEALIRDWQRSVLDLVREEAGDKRFVARSASYAVNATGLAVMIAVFTSTAFIPTGAEVAVGAGTTVAAQKVLEAVFGDQAIRALAARARADLLRRVDELLAGEAVRFTGLLAPALETSGDGLRAAGAEVERARADLQLIGPLR
ncbi:energy-coupling factor transporter ATP-binding protein EcfA2 [Spirilliplanes yamanashiensis]|nr:energy-coupling factor transporter ATP-binding protein EcfA2 [Spirilliplanes yamanashiensis]